MTHRFFADNHLLDLHDLRDVVSCWLERRSTRPVINADKDVSTYIITTVYTYQPTIHHTHTRTYARSVVTIPYYAKMGIGFSMPLPVLKCNIHTAKNAKTKS